MTIKCCVQEVKDYRHSFSSTTLNSLKVPVSQQVFACGLLRAHLLGGHCANMGKPSRTRANFSPSAPATLRIYKVE